MGESGVIRFEGEARLAVAAAVAGALAEAGVQRLTASDPRACRTWALTARECDLPAQLLGLPPGGTLIGEGVALLVDEGAIRWVADGPLTKALRAITPTEA